MIELNGRGEYRSGYCPPLLYLAFSKSRLDCRRAPTSLWFHFLPQNQCRAQRNDQADRKWLSECEGRIDEGVVYILQLIELRLDRFRAGARVLNVRDAHGHEPLTKAGHAEIHNFPRDYVQNG